MGTEMCFPKIQAKSRINHSVELLAHIAIICGSADFGSLENIVDNPKSTAIVF